MWRRGIASTPDAGEADVSAAEPLDFETDGGLFSFVLKNPNSLLTVFAGAGLAFDKAPRDSAILLDPVLKLNNIRVDAIPKTQTIFLVGLGLAAIGWRRCRRSA